MTEMTRKTVITMTIESSDEGMEEITFDHIAQQVREGYICGHDRNALASYSYSVHKENRELT